MQCLEIMHVEEIMTCLQLLLLCITISPFYKVHMAEVSIKFINGGDT